MASGSFDTSSFRLTPEKCPEVLAGIVRSLNGRVDSAFVFGCVATGDFTVDSDIGSILVNGNPGDPFFFRSLAFSDLYDIYPALDILVYAPGELERQLADSEIGFWKSVRLSMRRVL